MLTWTLRVMWSMKGCDVCNARVMWCLFCNGDGRSWYRYRIEVGVGVRETRLDSRSLDWRVRHESSSIYVQALEFVTAYKNGSRRHPDYPLLLLFGSCILILIPWPEPITCINDLQLYALPLITPASFLLLLAFLWILILQVQSPVYLPSVFCR